MFGRKKPSPEAAAVLPAAPVRPAEPAPAAPVAAAAAKSDVAFRAEGEDIPPMPGHLHRFAKPGQPTAPTPANQGPSMSDSTPTNPAPAFRPEIAKRPAMDLSGTKPVSAPAVAAAAAAAPAPAPAQRSEAAEPKVLMIGREISLTGQITACDRVVVEGKVEATLTDSRFVEIAETGQFKGTAEIDEAEIRGRFEGKLSVRGRLLIRGSGKVMGEIAYGQIEVECGGEISGTVQTVSGGRFTSAAAE